MALRPPAPALSSLRSRSALLRLALAPRRLTPCRALLGLRSSLLVPLLAISLRLPITPSSRCDPTPPRLSRRPLLATAPRSSLLALRLMMSTLLWCALTLPRLRPTDLVRRALTRTRTHTRTLTPLPVLPPVLITPLRCDLTPLRLHRTDLALRALTRTLTRTPLLVPILVLITISRCDLTRPRLRRTDLALRALTRSLARTRLLGMALITRLRCDLTRPRLRLTDLALRALTQTPLLVLIIYR